MARKCLLETPNLYWNHVQRFWRKLGCCYSCFAVGDVVVVVILIVLDVLYTRTRVCHWRLSSFHLFVHFNCRQTRIRMFWCQTKKYGLNILFCVISFVIDSKRMFSESGSLFSKYLECVRQGGDWYQRELIFDVCWWYLKCKNPRYSLSLWEDRITFSGFTFLYCLLGIVQRDHHRLYTRNPTRSHNTVPFLTTTKKTTKFVHKQFMFVVSSTTQFKVFPFIAALKTTTLAAIYSLSKRQKPFRVCKWLSLFICFYYDSVPLFGHFFFVW